MNIKKTLSYAAIAAGTLLAACGNAPQQEVSVEKFGAVPNDGKNDFEALRAATAYCRENPAPPFSSLPESTTSTTRKLVKLNSRQ